MKYGLAVSLFALLVACGGGGDSGGGHTDPPADPPPPDPVPVVSEEEAVLFLTRSSFGATDPDITTVSEQGYEAWLDQQMAEPMTSQLEHLDQLLAERGLDLDSGQALLRATRMDTWWEVSMKAPDQLRQRVAYALSQIMVISDLGPPLNRAVRGICDYHDTLAEHAFGNYRDLLEEVTLHPVMGDFLSMRRNEKADPNNNIRPDENYAREVMQLFSIGLQVLNPDGTPKLDGSGETISTYTQDDILNFARVYTGWNYGDASFFRSNRRTDDSFVIPMQPFENFHDTDPKTLLMGEMLPAGQTAQQDLDGALDNMFNHPNVGPFIATRLIERLVSSNPSPEYVARAAAVFDDNGSGVRGDLGALVKAILLDDEALNSHQDNATAGGKLKEPILRVTQLWRAFDGEGSEGVFRYLFPDTDLGQRPYGSPSVFNFYQPGHTPPGAIAGAALTAPEFQIVTDATIVTTTNRLASFAISADLSRVARGLGQVVLDIEDEKALASDPDELIDHLNQKLMGGLMSDELAQTLSNYIADIALGDGEERVNEALWLLVTSPEYAIQR